MDPGAADCHDWRHHRIKAVMPSEILWMALRKVNAHALRLHLNRGRFDLNFELSENRMRALHRNEVSLVSGGMTIFNPDEVISFSSGSASFADMSSAGAGSGPAPELVNNTGSNITLSGFAVTGVGIVVGILSAPEALAIAAVISIGGVGIAALGYVYDKAEQAFKKP